MTTLTITTSFEDQIISITDGFVTYSGAGFYRRHPFGGHLIGIAVRAAQRSVEDPNYPFYDQVKAMRALNPEVMYISLGPVRSNQAVFRFENGYGASVALVSDGAELLNEGTHEKPYELSIITSEGSAVLHKLPMTVSTSGGLSIQDVIAALEEISNLPENT